MSFFDRLVKVGKFGLVAAMLAMLSTMMTVPASAAPAVDAAPVSVVQAEKGDVGVNVPAYTCYYAYNFNQFNWDCYTGAGPGYLSAYVTCAPGTTYYSAWYPEYYYFWLYVYCGAGWTQAGLLGL